MADKHRVVNTKFWTDPYTENLDPSEKLLFLYFLTSPLSNIAGVYEVTIKRIAFETGFDKDMVLKILKRFEDDGKLYYVEGYICIKNFIDNQRLNDNMEKGVSLIMDALPERVSKALKGFERLSNPPLKYEIGNKKDEIRNKKEESVVTNVFASTFEPFWSSYPRKIGKGAAEAAWLKIKPRPTDEFTTQVIEKIEQLKLSYDWRKDSGAFIPHPSTWLNRKGWEDEVVYDRPKDQKESIYI